jgi:hypothetical protein
MVNQLVGIRKCHGLGVRPISFNGNWRLSTPHPAQARRIDIIKAPACPHLLRPSSCLYHHRPNLSLSQSVALLRTRESHTRTTIRSSPFEHHPGQDTRRDTTSPSHHYYTRAIRATSLYPRISPVTHIVNGQTSRALPLRDAHH